MYNNLNELAFYKGKSVMIIKTSIGVSYGLASPFLHFKFAPRDDYKSPGKWNDENAFWVTSYVDMCLFVKGITDVASGKEAKYELKNPAKGVTVSIYASKNDKDGTEYINFAFFKGDTKIHVSLTKLAEFYALYTYFKNLLDNYNTVTQMALVKYDIWYEFVGKNKQQQQQQGGTYAKPQYTNAKPQYTNAKPQYTNAKPAYNPNKNTGSYEVTSNHTSPQMDSAMNSVETSINSSQNNFDFDNSDVPF
jgi:hypothetical protein